MALKSKNLFIPKENIVPEKDLIEIYDISDERVKLCEEIDFIINERDESVRFVILTQWTPSILKAIPSPL